MILTVPAFILVMAAHSAAGEAHQAVAVMKDYDSCNNLELIIRNDFLQLRIAEKKLREEGKPVEPRTTLDSVKCWSIEVPFIGGQQNRRTVYGF